MEYFSHEYNGMLYEFKTNWRSRKALLEIRAAIMEEQKELTKRLPEIERLKAEAESLEKKIADNPEDVALLDRKQAIEEKAMDFYSLKNKSDTAMADIKFRVLHCVLDNAHKDQRVSQELFAEILDDMEAKYGEDFEEIVDEIYEQSFMKQGADENKAKTQNPFLANRRAMKAKNEK